MGNITPKEAIKYLIPPIATSTEPSAEYLKQKEAYELAIKALEEKHKALGLLMKRAISIVTNAVVNRTISMQRHPIVLIAVQKCIRTEQKNK